MTFLTIARDKLFLTHPTCPFWFAVPLLFVRIIDMIHSELNLEVVTAVVLIGILLPLRIFNINRFKRHNNNKDCMHNPIQYPAEYLKLVTKRLDCSQVFRTVLVIPIHGVELVNIVSLRTWISKSISPCSFLCVPLHCQSMAGPKCFRAQKENFFLVTPSFALDGVLITCWSLHLIHGFAIPSYLENIYRTVW